MASLKDLEIRNMKPTQKHRVAIVPGMLGTVYAIDAAGKCQGFDYDWDAAFEHAGITDDGADQDLRRSQAGKYSHIRSGASYAAPKPTTQCIWIAR